MGQIETVESNSACTSVITALKIYNVDIDSIKIYDSLEETNEKLLTFIGERPRAVAVNTLINKIYITTYSESKGVGFIKEADMDGENVKDITSV